MGKKIIDYMQCDAMRRGEGNQKRCNYIHPCTNTILKFCTTTHKLLRYVAVYPALLLYTLFNKSRARDSTTHSVRLSVGPSVGQSVMLSFFYVPSHHFKSF